MSIFRKFFERFRSDPPLVPSQKGDDVGESAKTSAHQGVNSSFLNSLKNRADFAAVEDHHLIRRNAVLSQRCAYFEGMILSCWILCGEISTELRHTLELLAESLHLPRETSSDFLKIQLKSSEETVEQIQEIEAGLQDHDTRLSLIGGIYDLFSKPDCEDCNPLVKEYISVISKYAFKIDEFSIGNCYDYHIRDALLFEAPIPTVNKDCVVLIKQLESIFRSNEIDNHILVTKGVTEEKRAAYFQAAVIFAHGLETELSPQTVLKLSRLCKSLMLPAEKLSELLSSPVQTDEQKLYNLEIAAKTLDEVPLKKALLLEIFLLYKDNNNIQSVLCQYLDPLAKLFLSSHYKNYPLDDLIRSSLERIIGETDDTESPNCIEDIDARFYRCPVCSAKITESLYLSRRSSGYCSRCKEPIINFEIVD